MKCARKDIATVAGTAMAVTAMVLNTPGSAAADATDDAFSHKLFADAVDFAPHEVSVKKARMVCDAFDAGMSPAQVHETLLHGSRSLPGSGFSPRQGAIFMADAVQFYCPGYAGQFINASA
jgi:hypothetical protein